MHAGSDTRAVGRRSHPLESWDASRAPGREAVLDRLTVLLLTAFLDSVGLLMIVPLLPLHATHLGAGGAVVGGLMATVPLVQLVSAPLWGRLSDRVGRKPVLLVGMGASVVASVLLALADSLPGLFLSRVAQGLGGGTVAVLQACVVDVTRPEERALALGRVSAATSLGVMMGPALGALGANLGPAAPGAFAAALGACNLLLAARWLPEARGPETPAPGASHRQGPEQGEVPRPHEPLARLVWTYVLAMGAFQGGTAVLSLLLASRFGLTPRTVGWVYVFTGAVAVVARALLLGRAVARLGERRLWRWGVVTLGAGLALLGFAREPVGLALALALMPLGTAFTFPCVTALLSRHAAASERGRVLGMQHGWGGVARALAPLGAGWSFEHLSPAAPYWLGAGLALLPLVLGGRPGASESPVEGR